MATLEQPAPGALIRITHLAQAAWEPRLRVGQEWEVIDSWRSRGTGESIVVVDATNSIALTEHSGDRWEVVMP